MYCAACVLSLLIFQTGSALAGSAAAHQTSRARSTAGQVEYAVITNYYNGKCLEDKGYEYYNGATADLWNCTSGESNQVWVLTNAGNGYDYIQNYYENPYALCLEDKGYETGNGATVDLWDCNSGGVENKEWHY